MELHDRNRNNGAYAPVGNGRANGIDHVADEGGGDGGGDPANGEIEVVGRDQNIEERPAPNA